MTSVSIRIDEELKEEMAELKINWSDYLRETIRKRVELEKRRGVARKLLEDLEMGVAQAPEGFIDETIRKMRARHLQASGRMSLTMA